MFFSFLAKRRRTRPRALAQCVEGVPGRLRLEHTSTPYRILMLSVDGMSAQVRIEEPLATGKRVAVEYIVRGITFGFQGEIVKVEPSQRGSWHLTIRYILVGR